MNNSMAEAKAGTLSPSKLAPETIRIRNALIEKYADQPIEELNIFLQHALEAEKDELKRLGLLAARVYILRQKVLSLKAIIRDERMNSIPTPNLALSEQILLDETAHSDIDIKSETVAAGEWHSLQMIEPGEVHGVRFFEGTIINAKAEDAEKLISSGKAIVIDDKGNPVENNKDDNGDSSDTIDQEVDTADIGIPSDDENLKDTNSLDATVGVDDNDNSNTIDPKAGVIDKVAVVDADDDSSLLDDENADYSNSSDSAVGGDDTGDDNMADSNADVMDEPASANATDEDIVSEDKNADDSQGEDGSEEKKD